MHEDSGVGTFTKFSLESCSGEARVNNRKGKIILFFEWNITLSYVTGNLISAHLRCIKMLFSPGVSGKRVSEVQGRIELHNFTEDLDDLEIFENTPSYSQNAFMKKTSITSGYFRTLICSRLEEYAMALKAEYGDKATPETKSALTKVKSKTVINNVTIKPKKTPMMSQSPQKSAKRKKKLTAKSSGSSDMIFYLSLLSILGLGVVVAVKLVNRL